ncbi:hypothetical protein [Brevibacterium antiquum]|nr:hypothetical protein [Brevibacterium antiquum]
MNDGMFWHVTLWTSVIIDKRSTNLSAAPRNQADSAQRNRDTVVPTSILS